MLLRKYIIPINFMTLKQIHIHTKKRVLSVNEITLIIKQNSFISLIQNALRHSPWCIFLSFALGLHMARISCSL